MLDDFLGKRLGNGNVFYGERWSEMDDDQFKKATTPKNKIERVTIKPLRQDPIVVIGESGET